MARRYDRDVTDLFEVQDEIVTTIAGGIEPELLKFERERITEHPPQSEDAYELYQRGMFHHYRQNNTDNIGSTEALPPPTLIATSNAAARSERVGPHASQTKSKMGVAITRVQYNGLLREIVCFLKQAGGRNKPGPAALPRSWLRMWPAIHT